MGDIINIGILAPLQKVLNTFQKERHYQDKKKEDALKAIQKALIETKRYVERSKHNRETEYDLAQLWADAATMVRYANTELAERLNDKSKYWQDTFIWSHEEILEKRIDFDSIEKQISDMLKS